MNKKKTPNIKSFFSSKPKEVKSAVPVPPRLTGQFQDNIDAPSIEVCEVSGIQAQSLSSHKSSESKLLKELRSMTARLPTAVPLAVPEDRF